MELRKIMMLGLKKMMLEQFSREFTSKKFWICISVLGIFYQIMGYRLKAKRFQELL